MVMSPEGLKTKNNCAGKGQQQFSSQSVKLVSCGQMPTSKDMSMEAEKYSLLGAAI
jgi:hypothetical protein